MLKRESLQSLGGFDESAEGHMELAFILTLLREKGRKEIHHIAEPLLIAPEPSSFADEPQELAILEKYIIETGYPNAQVIQLSPRVYRALYLQPETPLVSIIIPNQGIHLIQRCIESLLQNTDYSPYEILIIDNNSKDQLSINWLQSIAAIDPQKFRIVYTDGLENIYAMINAGAKAAQGELLVFVDTCVEFIESSWLDALLIHGQRSEVGAIGVKLVDKELNVLSAGYVLGKKFDNASAFIGDRFDNVGYLHRLKVDQSYSALSSQCLMVRSSVFESVGGFETTYNTNTETDIDFCLKLKAKGLDNIWTPHALVQLNTELMPPKNSILDETKPSDKFLRNWLQVIAKDSAYNKNLSLIEKAYSIEPMHELSWRPLSWRPQPVILAHPLDDTGSGQYRVIQPLSAMMHASIADGVISFRQLLDSELERIQPDTVIFQRPLGTKFLDYMKHSKTYSNAFKIYEIDDLITKIPIKNFFKSAQPKDIANLMREGIAQVDRLVVSTPGLAEAYSSWHSNIKILELKLPLAWWGNLKVNITEHKKPRVGWAGGSSHLGDLEMIADVVKDLANEVDWVFFGMCPQKLRPYVKEFHSGVPIHMYPEKLASLDLDLAIAPLENNQFNDCKSNLRLLEYGACGFPVVCSNTRAFVESKLPAQIVKNRYKDWIESIRSHVNEPQYSKAKGELLKESITEKWMLKDSNLNYWKDIWISN